MVTNQTLSCPGCGSPVEIERERRLYRCGNCKAQSYLNSNDADPGLINVSAAALSREEFDILSQRESELSAELRASSDRLTRLRKEQKRDGKKRKSTLQVLTANMVIIAVSALILSFDLTVDASQLVFAAALLVLTILTLMFLFLQNSMAQSAVFRLEVLEEEDRKVRRELDGWRAKIDLELRSALAGNNGFGENTRSEEE